MKLVTLLFVFIPMLLLGEPFIEELSWVNKEIAPFRSPSVRQIEHETSSRILAMLRTRGKHWDYWNQIIATEERGVFGYHGAKQKYRVFLDIVRGIFEELLQFEIKKEFQFFRIPLDPVLHEYASAEEFLQRYPQVDDAQPVQRDQIVSLNYTLFGNYFEDSQCSVCYFSNNQSWFTIDYGKRLEFLFNQLGIPMDAIPALFQTGAVLEKVGTGVLYQFIDTSHFENREAYQLLDSWGYQALGGGGYDNGVNARLSDRFQSSIATRFDRNYGQLRLIMSSSKTLNPYSSLSIRRYDLNDAETVKKYEEALRAKIRVLPRDPAKVEIYKKQIKGLWHVD